MNREEKVPDAATSGTGAENVSSDANTIDAIYYTDNTVIRLFPKKRDALLLTEEAGKAGKAAISLSIEHIKAIDASSAPLPVEYVFTTEQDEENRVFFGSEAETKRIIDSFDATKKTINMMLDNNIKHLAILRNVEYAQILYGRGEQYEFMKLIPIASPKAGECDE